MIRLRCPYCNSEIRGGSKFCTECGARLTVADNRIEQQRPVTRSAGNSGLLLGAAARQARLDAPFDPNAVLSDRAYNAVLVGVLVWGLLVNVVLCAYGGRFVESLNPVVFLIGYVVCAIAGIMIAGKSANPFISFLGYNLVVVPFGLAISLIVTEYGGIGAAVVRDAFLYTLLIALGMMAVVMIAPNLFAKIGGAMFGCLIGLVICEFILLLFGIRQVVTDWIAAGLFSLYIGYDIYRSQQFPKTLDNAVDSALDIYLDIANLFIRLLEIMGRRKD